MKANSLLTLGFLSISFVAAILYAANEKSTGAEVWNDTRTAFFASGGELNPASRLAEAVPDEKNFGAIPELRGINEDEAVAKRLQRLGLRHETIKWRQKKRKLSSPYTRCDLEPLRDYLKETGLLDLPATDADLAEKLLNAYEAEFGSIVESINRANNRPHAVLLPIRSTLCLPGQMILAEDGPPTKAIMGVARGLRLHSILSLRTGDPAVSKASISSALRLAEATSNDGKSILTLLISLGVTKLAMDPTWEAIADQSWSEEQLAELQNQITSFDVYATMIDAFRAELVAELDVIDHLEEDPHEQLSDLLAPEDNTLSKLTPILGIWADHNRATLLSFFDQSILAPTRANASYLAVRTASDRVTHPVENSSPLNMRVLFARLILPSFTAVVKNSAQNHTTLTQAATACALERYYLKNDIYPDTLQSLVPEFTKSLPLDPMDHEPLRYKKTDDGRYQLHSIGWDGKDDNGGDGDIVWNYQSLD